MRRCRHLWTEVRRTFAPGPERVKADVVDQDQMDRWIFGVTTVELRCGDCGDLKAVTMLGDLTK